MSYTSHMYKIQATAYRHMVAHGLTDNGWTFKWDSAKLRAGKCSYSAKTISLSRKLMMNWTLAAAEEIILHEIAHAITGPGHGHDYQWRTNARALGIKGDRCWTPSAESPALPRTYVGTCRNGHTIMRDRLTARAQRASCSACSPVFNEANRFVWARNS